MLLSETADCDADGSSKGGGGEFRVLVVVVRSFGRLISLSQRVDGLARGRRERS